MTFSPNTSNYFAQVTFFKLIVKFFHKEKKRGKPQFSNFPLLPPSTPVILKSIPFSPQEETKHGLHRDGRPQPLNQVSLTTLTGRQWRWAPLFICLTPNSFVSFHGEVGFTGKCHRITMYVWWPSFSISVSPWYYGLRARSSFYEIFTYRNRFIPDSIHLVFSCTKNNFFSNEAIVSPTSVPYYGTKTYRLRVSTIPTIFDRRRRVTRNS